MTDTLLGTTIGHYRILNHIASGGMGEIYVGYDETLERQVALKSIRPEYRLEEQAKARLLQEARALSQLGHPNICQIFDYIEGDKADVLVLELIEGTNLTQAMKKGLDSRVKMRIAEQVAGVLVAAHEKGVIHRDLKPDNIMLVGGEQVKVLDFGLSRMLSEAPTLGRSGDLTHEMHEGAADGRADSGSGSRRVPRSSANLTQQGMIMGTPGYMSPEQARGELVTAASDMYSFGLLLQELFTGKPPYEPGLDRAAQVLKARRGETLPVAAQDPDLVALIKRLKSFSSGARPSAEDTVEKLAWIREKPQRRRRKVLLSGAGAALVIFSLAMAFQSIRATRAERRAREEAETAEQVSWFLVDLFKVSDPGEAQKKVVTAREILDKGARKIDTELKGRPLVQARLLATMGNAYEGMGLYSESEPLLQAALALREEALPPDQGALVESLDGLASLYYDEGKYSLAEPLCGRALFLREKALGPDHLGVAESLSNLATVYFFEGKYAEAEPLCLRALAIHEKAHGADDPATAISQNRLAILYAVQGKFAEAEPLFKRALAIRERTLGSNRPELALSSSDWASPHSNRGKSAGDEPLHRRPMAIWEKALLSDRPYVATSLSNLALLYQNQGRYPEAEALLKRALALREKSLGPDHPGVAIGLNDLANLYSDLGRYTEAEPLLIRCLAIRQKSMGPESMETFDAFRGLAFSEFKEGRFDEALESSARCLEIGRHLGAERPGERSVSFRIGSGLLLKGQVEEAMGRRAEALASWGEALSILDPIAKDSQSITDQATFAQTLLCLGRTEEARPTVRRLQDIGYKDPDLVALCHQRGLMP